MTKVGQRDIKKKTHKQIKEGIYAYSKIGKDIDLGRCEKMQGKTQTYNIFLGHRPMGKYEKSDTCW